MKLTKYTNVLYARCVLISDYEIFLQCTLQEAQVWPVSFPRRAIQRDRFRAVLSAQYRNTPSMMIRYDLFKHVQLLVQKRRLRSIVMYSSTNKCNSQNVDKRNKPLYIIYFSLLLFYFHLANKICFVLLEHWRL